MREKRQVEQSLQNCINTMVEEVKAAGSVALYRSDF